MSLGKLQKTDTRQDYLSVIQEIFPSISNLPLPQEEYPDSFLRKLSTYVQYSVPTQAYSQQFSSSYQKLNALYWENMLYPKRSQPVEQLSTLDKNQSEKAECSSEEIKEQIAVEHYIEQIAQRSFQKKRINFFDLASFVAQSIIDKQPLIVDQKLVEQVEEIKKWKQIKVKTDLLWKKKKQVQKVQHRPMPELVKGATPSPNSLVEIKVGKNISIETLEMKQNLIKRSQVARWEDQNQLENNINFILNRVSLQFLDQFVTQLKDYTEDSTACQFLVNKIVEKAQEESNYIEIYVKMVQKISKFTKRSNSHFKKLLVEKIQQSFYDLLDPLENEDLHKKMLLNLCTVIGKLIKAKFLSLKIYSNCFFNLILSYIQQYSKHINDKSKFHFEVFFEAAILMIESMGKEQEQKMKDKAQTTNPQEIVCQLMRWLESDSKQINFYLFYNFEGVLKNLISKLPSQRFKLQFLLEDFKCRQLINHHQRQDAQVQTFDELMEMVQSNQPQEQLLNKAKQINPSKLFSKFLFVFAEGKKSEINKNIAFSKILMELDSYGQEFPLQIKQNFKELYLIECDYPYLANGLAQIIAFHSQKFGITFHQYIGAVEDDDEELIDFTLSLEKKVARMTHQD